MDFGNLATPFTSWVILSKRPTGVPQFPPLQNGAIPGVVQSSVGPEVRKRGRWALHPRPLLRGRREEALGSSQLLEVLGMGAVVGG